MALAMLGCSEPKPAASPAVSTSAETPSEIAYSIHDFNKLLDAPQKHPLIVVNNPHGNVGFRPMDGQQVEVIAAVQRLGDEPEVESIRAEQTEQGVEIEVSYPSDATKGVGYQPNGHRKGRVDLIIFVPGNATMRATTVDTSISARRIPGGISARSQSGNIKVSAGGAVDLFTQSGSIVLTKMKPEWNGASRAVTEQGGVTLFLPERAKPTLALATDGKIEVDVAAWPQATVEQGRSVLRQQGSERSSLTVEAKLDITLGPIRIE